MATPRIWRINGATHHWANDPWLMGIVNVTPDSFSDGGQHDSVASAVEQAHRLVEQGAQLIDIGGESTRPGAEPVSQQVELDRVIPVIEQLAPEVDVPISIDTTKAVVAQEALSVGASVINDVSALTFDQQMVNVCAGSECGVIIMHMRGTPQTMQANPVYDDVLADVVNYLKQRLDALETAGVAADRVVVDPGIGFGKTAAHNLELLQNISALHSLERPVLIGHSRKRFLAKLLGKPVDERLAGTIGVSIALAEQQTEILRVHDVGAVKDAITAWSAVGSN